MKTRRKRLPVDLAMRIATEHLSYRSLIEEIETDLEHVRRTPAESPRSLFALLVSFLVQVREHFALEERGGLFAVYREHDEASRHAARTMLAQHRDFLQRLARAVERAGALQRTDGPEFADLERSLRELFHDLRRHEHAEDALLERLVEQDIRRQV